MSKTLISVILISFQASCWNLICYKMCPDFWQFPRKFCSSFLWHNNKFWDLAQNSVGCWKLWSLAIDGSVDPGRWPITIWIWWPIMH